MNNIVPIPQISYFEIDVSEKIEDKNLKDFILTSLTLKNVDFNDENKILVNFISQLNQYQIFLLDKQSLYFEFQIFELLYENKKFIDDEYDLYICDDFFILYKNAFPYYFQKITNEINSSEFIEFLNKKLAISISNYKRVDNKEFEILKINYQNKKEKSTLKFLNIKSNHSFKIYLLFLFLIFTLFFIFIYNFLNQDLAEKTELNYEIKIEELKEKHKFESIEKIIRPLFLAFKKYDLNLKKMELKENSMKIIIESMDKKVIYSFLEEFKKEVTNSSINYFEDKKIYEVVLNVQIIK